MIKTRLVGLLSHAKKYIAYNVLCQWISLLAQIVAVFSVAGLLEQAVHHTLETETALRTSVVLLTVILIRFFC